MDTYGKKSRSAQPICVDRLLSQLALDKRILPERFSFPGAAAVFEEFYKREVYLRRRMYIPDQRLLECLNKVGQWLENPHCTTGLILAGNPGNGKTTALNTIARIIACSNQMDCDQCDYYGNPLPAKLNIYKATELIHYTTNDTEFNKLKRKTLLAIDDFGIEQVEVQSFGNIYTPIIELLEYRYSTGLMTILTTNLVVASIRERYGIRIADRFNEMMTCIAFPDISFRNREIVSSI